MMMEKMIDPFFLPSLFAKITIIDVILLEKDLAKQLRSILVYTIIYLVGG